MSTPSGERDICNGSLDLVHSVTLFFLLVVNKQLMDILCSYQIVKMSGDIIRHSGTLDNTYQLFVYKMFTNFGPWNDTTNCSHFNKLIVSTLYTVLVLEHSPPRLILYSASIGPSVMFYIWMKLLNPSGQ